MYYHDNTTPNHIKAIKRAKAVEMKLHTDAMKAITAKYAKALKLVESLRVMELEVGNDINQNRYNDEQLGHVLAVMNRNRSKANRVATTILHKSIDKL